MSGRVGRLRKAVIGWHEGEAYSVNTPDSPVVILPGICYRRHWSAEVVRAVAAFHQAEWKWAIPVYLSACGLTIALLKLG